MSQHKITYDHANGKEFAYCSCPFSTHHHREREPVEEEVRLHLHNVEVARAALATKTPSLKHQLEHYEKMAEDPETSEYDRGLWRQMANELRHRLGGDTAQDELPGLW